MHWEGTDRLSPYYGAELMFSTVSNKETNQVWDAADATTREGEKKNQWFNYFWFKLIDWC